MEYSIDKLAKLSGVTKRTLRHYDQIGLLTPKRVSGNGYRVYGPKEVDLLQHILFYRELGLSLDEIRVIVSSEGFDPGDALTRHLSALRAKRVQLDVLIATVETTISARKGELMMHDKEKFEGFKKNLLDENERKYGAEIREKFGEETVEQSNQKFMGLSPEDYARVEALSAKLNETLKAAHEQGDPAGELAQQACELHHQWLCYFWPHYSKEAHVGLGQMYVDDPRFSAYYDAIAPGCAVFLRDALNIYCR